MTRYPQADDTIFLCTMFLCTKGKNNTISASGRHDFSCTILLCTKGTNDTISASGIHDFLHDSSLHEWGTNETISASGIHDFLHDFSLHERHELYDFRKRKARCFFESFEQLNRVVDLSISCYSCLSCKEKIVLSTCRHRAIRAMKNRVVDLSTSYHSCHSCKKNRAVDLSTSYHSCPSCKKNRAIDLSISYHSCLSCIVKSHGKQHYMMGITKKARDDKSRAFCVIDYRND